MQAAPVDLQLFLGGGLLAIGVGVLVWLVSRLVRRRLPRGAMGALLLGIAYAAIGVVLVLQAGTGQDYTWLAFPAVFVLFIGVGWYIRGERG